MTRSDADPRRPTFVDEHLLLAGACEFHCDFPLDDIPAGRIPVMKPRDMVEAYLELVEAMAPRRIVELGIRRGGSTALLAELTSPEKLVAVELAQNPGHALSDYLAARDLGDTVRPYYGVDQADRDRLAAIVDDEFGGEPIDLVIDDASHRYDETLASFETLFPRLRTGGVYVLEDWSWQHVRADKVGGPPSSDAAQSNDPLSRLVIELLLALARRGDGSLLAGLTVSRHWVAVTRAGGECPSPLLLDSLFVDHFDQVGP